jgi:tRNA(Ile)-lysidine synthase
MTSSGEPIAPDELERLFGPLGASSKVPCALAVSGGSDSTALMVLFAGWLARCGQDPARHVVLTVDHGLRAASAAEAVAVAAQAAALGFRHGVLVWDGPKPPAGIQAAARRARYALIAGYMRANGIASLLTAHTRDDQAETLLMRLARGSGVDGLAAMAPRTPLAELEDADGLDADAIEVLRPLLGVAKARLQATLASRGIGWIEDPSNQMPEFERTRLRAALPQLAEIGLTGDMLALSAMRLRRARAALADAADRFCAPASGNLVAEPWGRIVVQRERLRAAGEEIALRAMAGAIAAAGGAGRPVPMAKLEPIVAVLIGSEARDALSWTLARAMIGADGGTVVVEREPGRVPPPKLSLTPGAGVLWDGRFTVHIGSDLAARAVEVRPLGADALADLRRRDGSVATAPARAAALVPSIWLDGELIAVPPLRHWAAAGLRDHLRADFAGIRTRNRGALRPS